MTTSRNDFFIPTIGVIVGLLIGYVDSRPAWDDAGITAVAVFLSAAILAWMRPNSFRVIGLSVGLPVFLLNVVLDRNYGSALAVVIALAGSAIGYQMRKALLPLPK